MKTIRLKYVLLSIFLLSTVVFFTLSWFYFDHIAKQLPSEQAALKKLTDAPLEIASEVFDKEGRKIGEFSRQRRYFVELSNIPEHVIKAFLSAEDKDFFDHHGINPLAIMRAIKVNLKAGRITQGASTITQQLARLYFLESERSFTRKIKEAVLALFIESRLSKKQILELYLNKIYLGSGSYGIEAAARTYFNKKSHQLDVSEAALLAGLPKAPSRYAPNVNFPAAKKRQRFVLKQMYLNNFLSKNETRLAYRKRIVIEKQRQTFSERAPYFLAELKKEISKKLAIPEYKTQGLKIYTTLDANLQAQIQDTLKLNITSMRVKAESQGLTEKNAHLQGAALSIDPWTGEVVAIQGGSDFNATQYNRAIYTKRQLGHLFLPIYLSVALESGYALTSRVDEVPITRGGASKNSYPTLYEVLMNADIEHGVLLFASLGVGTVSHFAHALGLRFKINDLRLALGRGKASPEQVSVAYSSFINGGNYVSPYLIKRIETLDGKALYKKEMVHPVNVISEETSHIITQALRHSVDHGPGKMAKVKSQKVAGYPGVSSDLQNAWFVGMTPNLVTTVWIGAERGLMKVAASQEEAFDQMANIWRQIQKQSPRRSKSSFVATKSGKITYTRVSFGKGEVRTLPFVTGHEPKKVKF